MSTFLTDDVRTAEMAEWSCRNRRVDTWRSFAIVSSSAPRSMEPHMGYKNIRVIISAK